MSFSLAARNRREVSECGSPLPFSTVGACSNAAEDCCTPRRWRAGRLPKRVSCAVSFTGLVLLLATTGCAPLTRRQSPPQPPTANFGQRTLKDSELKRFIEEQSRQLLENWPLRTWDFPTLTLAACYFSPELATARNQWQQAEMQLAAARGQPSSGEAWAQAFPPGALLVPLGIAHRTVDTARPLDQPLPPTHTNVVSLASHSSKHARRIAEAERVARSARWRLQAVMWQVRSDVRTNLIAYVALERGVALLEELEAANEKLVKSAESRVARDAMSYLELSRLRLQLAQTRLALIRVRLERMDARVRLAEAISLPVNVLFDVDVDFDFSRRPPLFLTERDLRWQALHSRPDVLTILAEYTEAESALRSEIGKRRPHAPLPSSCTWDERKNRWEVNTELGLSARQRNSRNTARAESRRLAAAAGLLKLQSDIVDEVERSAAVYRVTAEEVADVHALVSALVRQYATLEDRFEAGVADAPELLLARMQLLATGFAKLEAQVKLQNALGSLEDALQVPVELIGNAKRF